MISNDDPKAMIPPLLKAQAAGIKIINIDGDLAEKNVGITNIQSDNTIGGQEAGQEMVKLTHGKAGTVLVEDNAPGYPISEQRRSGLIAYIRSTTRRSSSCRSPTRTMMWPRPPLTYVQRQRLTLI